MSSHNHGGNAGVIAAVAIAVILVVTFTAMIGHYVMKRTQHATDEENKPLLSNDEPITMYDEDAGTSIESIPSKTIQSIEQKVLTNATFSASPTALSERATTAGRSDNDQADEQKVQVETSGHQPSPSDSISISSVLSGASRKTSAAGVQTKTINVQREGDRDRITSKGRSGFDGAVDIIETSGRSVDKVNGPSSSSFLDSFLPPQGLVEAMKAKLKGSAIPENSKEASIVAEVNSKLIDLANDNDHAVKLCTVSDEANDPTDRIRYDINLGSHNVAPPGAFPTSPKEATRRPPSEVLNKTSIEPPNQAEGDTTAAKRAKKTTGSKLPKRRRQASKSEDTPSSSLAPSAASKGVEQPIRNVRAVGCTYAQAIREDSTRRSSAPGPENSSHHGGNSLNKSQRRRYARKKSNSVAAAMPPVEGSALVHKD